MFSDILMVGEDEAVETVVLIVAIPTILFVTESAMFDTAVELMLEVNKLILGRESS